MGVHRIHCHMCIECSKETHYFAQYLKIQPLNRLALLAAILFIRMILKNNDQDKQRCGMRNTNKESGWGHRQSNAWVKNKINKKKQACYDRNVSLRWESGVKRIVRHKRSWENVLESPLDSRLIRGHLEYILGVQAYEWQKRGGICCGLNVKYLPYVLCT